MEITMNDHAVTVKIGTNLTNLLSSKNLSLRELSRATGVPYTTLQEWTANRTPRNPVQIQKVASYFDVSMHFLLFGQEDKSEPLTKLLKEDLFSGTFEISIKRVKLK